MPSYYMGAIYTRTKRCRIKVTWSTMRGGCRFTPNHAGPCKPKGR